ncbi:MAG: sugar phosphate nucleotidyltransferase [Promethearchaeota archaeon]
MEDWSAVILAGGMGKRLQPLTNKICKPLVKVTNKPMVDFAIDHLRYAGIKHIIVCVKFMGDVLTDYLVEKWKPVMEGDPDFNLEIPNNDSNGTADAVRQVWDHIDTDNFIVSMADIITNLPMKRFKDYHLMKNADSTISMKPVDEFATKYGNTVLDSNGKIQLFMEKPSTQEIFISSLAGNRSKNVLPIINTGIYCFKKETAHRCIMETNHMDFGKEIFPFLLENKYNLYGFVERYYWMDIGNPKTYLWSNWDILREYGWPILPNGNEELNKKIWFKKPLKLPSSIKIEPQVCLGENIVFGEDVKINSLTVIGDNVEVGDGTVIEKSVLWDNITIGKNCTIIEAVIADGCKIGNNCVIRSESVLAPNVVVEDGTFLDSIIINEENAVRTDKMGF